MIRFAPLFAAAAIFLAGCGGEYAAEKLYWKANKIRRAILINPVGAPPGQYRKAREAFQRVIRKHPQSNKATQAQIVIGELHALEGNTEKAEEILTELANAKQDNNELAAALNYSIGRMHEKVGKWDRALKDYNKILQKYPETLTVISLRAHIARSYAQRKEYVPAKQFYREAIQYYIGVEKKYPGTQQALVAFKYHAQCLVEMGLWEEALRVLDALLTQYPGTPDAAKALIVKSKLLKGLPILRKKSGQSEEKRNK